MSAQVLLVQQEVFEPSHVLSAMGLNPEEAKASLRFSLGYATTQDMLDNAAEKLAEAIQRCRVFA